MADDDEPTADAPRPRGRPRTKTGTPVAAMDEVDRELVTRTARRAYQILEVLVERLWDEVAESDGAVLSPKTTAAMLSLQKMAAGMIDKHPGLLAELQAQGPDPEATDEELEKILEAVEGQAEAEEG